MDGKLRLIDIREFNNKISKLKRYLIKLFNSIQKILNFIKIK